MKDSFNRRYFYLGVFAITCATLMLEILNTRILSVMAWYHLAFFVISIVMFGMTLGTVLLYLFPSFFAEDKLFTHLGQSALAFGITTALTHLVTVSLPILQVGSVRELVALFVLTVNLGAPFVFSGLCVALALTRSPFPAGRVYAADLAGAASGCLLVILLMKRIDAHSAVFAAAALGLISAALFFTAAKRPAHRQASLALALIALVVVLANSTTLRGIRPLYVKGALENQDDIVYEAWNSYSRVSVFKPRPFRFSIPPYETRLSKMNIDGLADTEMYQFDGDPHSVLFLLGNIKNVAYHLRPQANVGIIGVGGGPDVLAAVASRAKSIVGIELNPIFVRLHQNEMRRFGNLAGRPEIRLVCDEARTYLAAAPHKFDLLQMALIDTWAATGAGAFTLSENGLYTLEAWRIFLDRLSPTGLLTVSRWFNPGKVNETTRTVSLAAAALLDARAPDPERCIALFSKDALSTVIVSREPYSEPDLDRLRQVCGSFGYNILLMPGEKPASPLLGEIVSARSLQDLARLSDPLPLNITPPTDDKPFFFNLLKISSLGKLNEYLGEGGDYSQGVINGNMIATMTLIAIFFITLFLAVATILLPLLIKIDFSEWSMRDAASGTVFFAALGLGFMFAEIGLLQRLSIFLGNPVYSLALVLATLILFTGVGSLISERIGADRRRAVLIVLGIAAAALQLLFMIAIPAAAARFQTFGLPMRAAITVLMIVPAATIMGFFFPLGLKAMAAVGKGPLPWFFGVNGAAGVFASTAAVLVSVTVGIRAAFALAAACYLLAAFAATLFKKSPGK